MLDIRQPLELPAGMSRSYFSLPLLERSGVGVSRLPVSLRVLLESLLRNLDGTRVREEDVLALATLQARAPRVADVPFIVGRVLREANAEVRA